jgi:hypothetical protein
MTMTMTMTMTVLDRALVAGDAGRVTCERQDRADPEVPEKARRRTFTPVPGTETPQGESTGQTQTLGWDGHTALNSRAS